MQGTRYYANHRYGIYSGRGSGGTRYPTFLEISWLNLLRNLQTPHPPRFIFDDEKSYIWGFGAGGRGRGRYTLEVDKGRVEEVNEVQGKEQLRSSLVTHVSQRYLVSSRRLRMGTSLIVVNLGLEIEVES